MRASAVPLTMGGWGRDARYERQAPSKQEPAFQIEPAGNELFDVASPCQRAESNGNLMRFYA